MEKKLSRGRGHVFCRESLGEVRRRCQKPELVSSASQRRLQAPHLRLGSAAPARPNSASSSCAPHPCPPGPVRLVPGLLRLAVT